MNQIICDICGFEYEDTAEACPMCGYPRQGAEKTAPVDRTKVKGGRFSKKNVKKRHKAQRKAAEAVPEVPKEKKESSDKPLLVVIALLLVAIVLVSVYIFQYIGIQRLFMGSGNIFDSNHEHHEPVTTAPADTTVAPTVPCTGILMDTNVIALDALGQIWKLELTVMPEDTTDVLTFASSDERVILVSEDGTLTAVGSGRAEITITCGTVVKTCNVVCWFGEETTVPPETTVPTETVVPTETTQPQESQTAVLTLDPVDVSCFSVNETFTIYPRLGGSSVSRSQVTWSTSAPNVATVKDGVVTAVGKGEATITAEYEGKSAVCIVRCRFENPTNQGNQENQEGAASQSWKASHSDVSISVGETFRLTIKNGAGETADAIWTMDVDGIVAVDGKSIIGRNRGTVTLTTTVDGVTFTCIVRVR